LIKPKAILLITILSLFGCGKLPPAPPVWQCAYSIKFNKFRCVNSQTKEATNLRRDDPAMEAAQCLSADDYKKGQRYVALLKRMAEERCK
jgi:hypothetical protein